MPKYSDAEKAAYYRKKAAQGGSTKKTYTRSSARTTTPKKKTYTRSSTRRAAPSKSSGLLEAGGSALGAAIGGAPGSLIGGKIGHLVSKITGFGDYKIEQNTLMKGGMTAPQIVNSTDKGGFILRHREYIGDITATTSFTNRAYLVNPGLSQTFPWLSQVANSFEQYRLRGVIFEFNTTSSDALLSSSTSTALGTVIMATEYDVADTPYNNKRDMLTSEFSCSSKPSCSFIHPIECKKSLSPQTMLYTRDGAVPSGFDQRLYDFCRFNIATEGMQASGGVLGELWVVYEVELYKQQFNFTGLTDHFRFISPTTNRPLGTVVGSNLANGGTMGGLISGDALSYSFPPQYSNGLYLVTYCVCGTTNAVNARPPTSITTDNCTGVPLFNNNTFSDVTNSACPTPGGQRIVKQFTVRINSQSASFTFNEDAIMPADITGGDLWVTRVADSIV